MAIDRLASRRRVATITRWSAAGAAVLTGLFAIGAARGSHAATQTSSTGASTAVPPQEYQAPPGYGIQPDQGFVPPSAGSGPPAGMSGGS
jgi:hypothetical protein